MPRARKKRLPTIPNDLRAEFHALLARMQRPGARKAMDKAFDASPAELGKPAVAAARNRR